MSQTPILLPDDVLALLAETAALAKAGIPLEAGLRAVAHDLPPRMQKLAEEFSRRLERGEPLEQVLADPRLRLPAPYAAVVTAGIRSGRLGEALQESVDTGRRLQELRRYMRQALWYPLGVALLAYGVWMVIVVVSVPTIQRLYIDSRLDAHWLIRLYRPLLAHWHVWGPLIPALALAAVGAWQWYAARRWPSASNDARPVIRRLPRLRHVAALGHQAQFTEILALLIRHETPLDQAVQLAAESTGNRRLARAGGAVAQHLAAGQTVRQAWPDTAPLSPMARCLLLAGGAPAQLAARLHDAAATLHRVARLQAERSRVFWPVAWTVAIGGLATLLAAVSLFAPITNLYQQLALP